MSNNKSSGGIGFLGLLTLVFITLKLCDVIAWSWGWVLCPLWAIPALFILISIYSIIHVALFSTPQQREQMRQIREEQNKNAGKSKWQIRMEQMQEAQKLRK